MMAAVFSTQGLGQLTAAVVALITAIAFKDSYINVADETACDVVCRTAADRSWRIIVGVGAIPACLALYYRITIPETPRYTFDIEHDVEKGDADIRAYVSSKAKGDIDVARQARLKKVAGPSLNVPLASWKDLVGYFGTWKNMKVLIGTTMSWFFLDLAFYGLGMNNTVVLHAIGYAEGGNLYDKLYNQAMGMIILTCAGSLPGYWFAIFTVDTIGRKPLQIIGFFLLCAIFCILGFMLDNLSEASLLGLYIAGQFLFNAGPNTTTFIVPGECFPTRYRATGHGVSAAMGKIGAIIAQGISIPILRNGAQPGCQGNDCSPWLDHLLQLFALFMFLGMLVSFLIPETKGVTLEELAGEPRTSYNAGYGPTSPNVSTFNIFKGGQSAGFLYPRSRPFTPFTTRHRRQSSVARVGIMTTPELGPEPTRHRRPRIFDWRTRHRGVRVSGDADDIGFSGRPYIPGGQGAIRIDEIFPDGSGGYHEMPGWMAGWGRVSPSRGPPPLTSSAALQDVGSLLQKP